MLAQQGRLRYRRRGAGRAATSRLLAGAAPAAPHSPLLCCASRPPIFAPTGYRPRAHEALRLCDNECRGGVGNAVVGCAPAATWGGAEERRAEVGACASARFVLW